MKKHIEKEKYTKHDSENNDWAFLNNRNIFIGIGSLLTLYGIFGLINGTLFLRGKFGRLFEYKGTSGYLLALSMFLFAGVFFLLAKLDKKNDLTKRDFRFYIYLLIGTGIFLYSLASIILFFFNPI